MLPIASTAAATAEPGDAADPMQSPLRATDLAADVAVLRRAYETLHPGLYRYRSQAQMDALFDRLAYEIAHDQPLPDVYRALSVFAAQIRCGHTYANFLNQPAEVADRLFTKTPRVPFYFDWIDRRMTVTTDLTATSALPRGTEILAIDGVPTATILRRLLTIARADGSNDAKRVATLNVSGESRFETFDIFYPLFFPMRKSTLELLVCKPASTSGSTVVVEPLTYQARVAPIERREREHGKRDAVVFEWRYLADGVAYLRMPTWAIYDSTWDWKAWLTAHFDDLVKKQAPALIIDLRGNEGGQDVGNAILARLIRSDLSLEETTRLVRYRRVPDELQPYLDTWDPTFKDWGSAATELPKPLSIAPPVHYFRLAKSGDDADGDRIVANGKPYTGRVAILVDASNSSATFEFAQTVQQKRLGTLVGEPTGGNQRGINGGAFFFLRLPHSRIEMDLPLIATFPSGAVPDAGLTPDLTVHRTINDVIGNTDPVMAAALAFALADDRTP